MTPGEKTDETEEGEGPTQDLTGYMPTGEDKRIMEVYRDWVHSNDGAHLSGGVTEIPGVADTLENPGGDSCEAV